MIVSTRIILSYCIFIVALLGLLTLLYLVVKNKIGRGYLVGPAIVLIHTAAFYGYVLFDDRLTSEINALWSSILRLQEVFTVLTILLTIGANKNDH